MTTKQIEVIDKTIEKLEKTYWSRREYAWGMDCPMCDESADKMCAECPLQMFVDGCYYAESLDLLRYDHTPNKDIPFLIEFLICMKEQL